MRPIGKVVPLRMKPSELSEMFQMNVTGEAIWSGFSRRIGIGRNVFRRDHVRRKMAGAGKIAIRLASAGFFL